VGGLAAKGLENHHFESAGKEVAFCVFLHGDSLAPCESGSFSLGLEQNSMKMQ
jgi:hypothetical protein